MSKYAKSNRCDLRLKLLKFSKTITYDRVITVYAHTAWHDVKSCAMALNHFLMH